jgi:excisionase family DNA binding protein
MGKAVAVDPERITLREAAERLGVHYMTAYRYVRTGRLPAEREGVEWRVRPSDLEALRQPPSRTARSRRTRASVVERLVRRLVAGDEAGAWSVVEAELVSGATPTAIHLDLLAPALHAIGEQWESGTLEVADEHRATAVAQRVVGRLGPRFARRGRKRGTVVLGVVAGDEHSLPSAMLADLLRGSGFDALDLGADTPAASFVATASQAARLVAVVIGATGPGHDASLAESVAALHRGQLGAPVLVGGAAVTDAADAARLGADGWTGPTGASAVAAVERVAEERRP